MKLVKPSFEILDIYGDLQSIEKIGRTCYKSEDNITDDSAKKFVENIIKRGHHSVLEHSAISVKLIVDRGVTHEAVRHRLCAFSQESTRYCNYKGGVTFIIPGWTKGIREGTYNHNDVWMDEDYWKIVDPMENRWFSHMADSEECYIAMLDKGWTPQQARSVLPNSLKTEINMTANFREWRHIFKLRCSQAAHPQMREVMIPLKEEIQKRIPIIFDDCE